MQRTNYAVSLFDTLSSVSFILSLWFSSSMSVRIKLVVLDLGIVVTMKKREIIGKGF